MTAERKSICVLTMVRNDDFYLRRWVEYYGRELGKENLYIFFDGTDQKIPDFCAGTNVQAVERVLGQVVAADKGRIDLLSGKAIELLKKYGQNLAFTAYGTPFFTYKYKKTGLVETDAELLLGKTEELLKEMELLLPVER